MTRCKELALQPFLCQDGFPGSGSEKQPGGRKRRQLFQIRGESPRLTHKHASAIKPCLLLFLSYCILSPKDRDHGGFLPLHLTTYRLQVLLFLSPSRCLWNSHEPNFMVRAYQGGVGREERQDATHGIRGLDPESARCADFEPDTCLPQQCHCPIHPNHPLPQECAGSDRPHSSWLCPVRLHRDREITMAEVWKRQQCQVPRIWALPWRTGC